MQGIQYRTWAPPESSRQIEYPVVLLGELGLGGRPDTAGILYGERRGKDLRVISVRAAAGLVAVGIFASRARGEIFMTESDVQRLEASKISDGVALVRAGARAGFFLSELDGSMQTIQSHLEFAIEVAPVVRGSVPNRVAFALACLGLAAVPLFARISAPRVAVYLRDDGGQLRITWDPVADGRLTIRDGVERISIPIGALTSVTYDVRTRDVEVSLRR